MASANPPRSVLARPPRTRFIVLTLTLSLMANLLPWNGIAVLLWPDLVALVLLYWMIHYPRRVGLASAWFLGLVMDIADGVLFGQHALGYVLIGYAAWLTHRRLQTFNPWQQALYVLGFMLLLKLTMLLIRLAFGAAFPGWLYFAGSLTAAVLWPLLTLVLQLPQRRPPAAAPPYGTASR
ncbi:rod shape-determining protein MreD [Thiobacter aerophilum]|uniref:Rod shape-determining protein MreD n=1 Tax=Thiobacter aerophilum TaxID=3121275 RepID=A0ABV0ED58_9BURK